jgi:hypothetical protein
LKVRRLVEEVAEEMHRTWLRRKRKRGVKSHLSPWGEELMVPWVKLSKKAKDDNRRMVIDTQAAITARMMRG